MTGSSGLIGSQTVESLVALGFNVVGVDNDMRSFFLDESPAQNGTKKDY